MFPCTLSTVSSVSSTYWAEAPAQIPAFTQVPGQASNEAINPVSFGLRLGLRLTSSSSPFSDHVTFHLAAEQASHVSKLFRCPRTTYTVLALGRLMSFPTYTQALSSPKDWVHRTSPRTICELLAADLGPCSPPTSSSDPVRTSPSMECLYSYPSVAALY